MNFLFLAQGFLNQVYEGGSQVGLLTRRSKMMLKFYQNRNISLTVW